MDFICDGLKQAEQCLCIGSRRDVAQLTTMLSRHSFDRTMLQVTNPEDRDPQHRPFQLETITDVMHAWSTTTFTENGSDPGRVIADMTWTAARSSRPSIGDLARIERGFTAWTRANSHVAVSMYDVESFGGAIVTTFVGAHRKVWVCGLPVETRTQSHPKNR